MSNHSSESRANFIDFHCHPAMKPLGKSFKKNPIGKNSSQRNRVNSIWRYDPPNLVDKLLNFIGGLTKFSQSNFTALSKAEVSVICASLYPIEREFFDNDLNPEPVKDLTLSFVTGVGKKRVNHIQKITDYFKDLELEYNFYLQLHQKEIKIRRRKFSYQLVNNYQQIIDTQNQSTAVETICVIPSIEGLHVLNSDTSNPINSDQVLANLQKIKNWEYPPLFVTVAHHFWNHICGHAKSFDGAIKKFIDQETGLDEGFTPLGKQVLQELLSTANGKRILVDVKHMSIKARKEYYALLKSEENYQGVPIIVSHGAVNGYHSFDNEMIGGSTVANKLQNTDINVYNSEIIDIARSNGIIGLQLDERRLANEKTLKKTKNSIKRNKILHYRSELLWNQVQHIVEVLDNNDQFAWDCMVIGSDFDGIIDPLNGYWTAEELPYLQAYLERHAYNFLIKNTLKRPENRIGSDDAVERIFSLNGARFLERYFK